MLINAKTVCHYSIVLLKCYTYMRWVKQKSIVYQPFCGSFQKKLIFNCKKKEQRFYICHPPTFFSSEFRIILKNKNIVEQYEKNSHNIFCHFLFSFVYFLMYFVEVFTEALIRSFLSDYKLWNEIAFDYYFNFFIIQVKLYNEGNSQVYSIGSCCCCTFH